MSEPNPDDGQDARTELVEALSGTPVLELMERMRELQTAAIEAGLSTDEVGVILNERPELPRPLLANERDTLLAVLEHGHFPGRDALLAQVDTARVTGYCGCGCATVDLGVDASAPCAPAAPSPVPVETQVVGADGEPLGVVLVFLRSGYLSLLEVAAYEDRISPFPAPHELDFTPLADGS